MGSSMEESWHDDLTHECTPAASTGVRVVMSNNFCCVEGVGKVLLSYRRCDGWSFFSSSRSSLSGTYICWHSGVQFSGLEDMVNGVPRETMVPLTSGPCSMLRFKEHGAELKRTSLEGIYVGPNNGWVQVFFFNWVLYRHMTGRGVIEVRSYLNSSADKKFRFPGSSSLPWICPSDTPVYFTLNSKCHCYCIAYCHYMFCHFILHEIIKTSVFFFT